MNCWLKVPMVFLALLGFLPSATPVIRSGEAFAADRTLAELEAEYGREQNPRRRVGLAVTISDERLKTMLSAYQGFDSEKEEEESKNYLSAVERLEKAVHDHSVKGVFKDAEIHLRRQARDLEGLRMRLSAAEQRVVDRAIARVNKLHEEILYQIMNLEKHE